jgi:hypothetical protein
MQFQTTGIVYLHWVELVSQYPGTSCSSLLSRFLDQLNFGFVSS